MESEAGTASTGNGLKNAIDIVIAPKEALERLRVAPTWGWALLIVIVLYGVSSYLLTPAIVHATQADWPRQVAANPQLAQLTPEEQQRYLGISLKVVSWIWLISPVIAFIAIAIQAIVMLIFKALGKGSASFGTIWAAAANIQIPVLGINSLVTALIVMLRGADAYNSSAAIQTAMPSLGLLVDPSMIKLHGFLSAIQPFTLWGCGLTIAAMAIAVRVDRTWAWATGILWLLASAGFVALAVR